MDEVTRKLQDFTSSLTPFALSQCRQHMHSPVLREHGAGVMIPTGDAAKQLRDIYGHADVDAFFRPPENRERLDSSLESFLHIQLSECVDGLDQLDPRLDQAVLLARLQEFHRYIASGKMPFSLVFRIANIEITNPFQLSNNITIRELDDYELKAFDIHIDHWNLSPYLRSDWKRHRVVAEVGLVGTPAEYEAYGTVEKQGELVNVITHPFYLQGIHWTVAPTVTNIAYRSMAHCWTHEKSMHNVSHRLYRIDANDVSGICRWHTFLKSLPEDSTLLASVDRALLGMKRSLQHPNRTNSPNWDKAVDYVIAMESLLTKTQGGSVSGETSYRFRLNGASLLYAARDDCDSPRLSDSGGRLTYAARTGAYSASN